MNQFKGWLIIVVSIIGFILVTQIVVSQIASEKAAVAEAPQTAARVMTIAGTGVLETENEQWFVRAPCQPEIELGTIDQYTEVRGYDLAGTARGRLDLMKGHFLNHRVTVVVTIEGVVDNEKVFRPIRTRRLEIFRHSDGRPEQ